MQTLTIREFQNIFLFCENISTGKIGKEKITKDEATGEPKVEFEPMVKLASPLWYAAKRFCELNASNLQKIRQEVADIGYNLCLTDKDTGEILYNKEGKYGPHEYRFKKSEQKKYETEIKEYFDKEVSFDVKTYKCPTDKLPLEVPFDLHYVNGYILQHKFYDEFEPETVNAGT